MTADNIVRLAVRDSQGRAHNLSVTRSDAAALAAQLVSRGVIAPAVLVRRVIGRSDRFRVAVVGPCPYCSGSHTHIWPRVRIQPGEHKAPCKPDRSYLLLASPGQMAGAEERQ